MALSFTLLAAIPMRTENINKWIIFPSDKDWKILVGKILDSVFILSIETFASKLDNKIGS